MTLSIQERNELNNLFIALERARKPFIVRLFSELSISLKHIKKLYKKHKHF